MLDAFQTGGSSPPALRAGEANLNPITPVDHADPAASAAADGDTEPRAPRDPKHKTAIVPGEYDHVALASGNTTLLREAHATPCIRAEAQALLMELAGLHGVSGLLVRFTSPRGLAGFAPVYRRERYMWPNGRATYRHIHQGEAPCVWLPRVPMEPGGDWYARLRVGLVLHEFAHHLEDDSDFDVETGCAVAGPAHGPCFVTALDKLVAWWAESRRSVARRAMTSITSSASAHR
jgi:hypothetical protein